MAEPTDIAWAAGFIDGEGCIYLKRSGARQRGGGLRYQPKLVVGNTAIEPLRKLRDLFGGSLYQRRPARGRHKACWAWELGGGKQVGAALLAMLPYLVNKKAEAEVLLEFIPTMRGDYGASGALTPGEIADRDAVVTRLQVLKAS
jgi:hypothetical protein